MPDHTHQFVEEYNGFVGFGMDRSSDENTVIYYLQKFSDDAMMKHVIKKMSDIELDQVFTMISGLLKKHLTEPEYHRIFLKEE